MLAKVKAPSRSWKAPTRSPAVGAMRNIAAKTKNGATPSQAAKSGAGIRWEGVGAALMAVRFVPVSNLIGKTGPPAIGRDDPANPSLLRDRRADDGVPLLGDHLFGRLLLVERWKLRLGVALRRRQRGQHIGWRLLGLDKVVETDGVAVAFEPG